MNTYKKNKHSVNNGLAVAITWPPAIPSLARAQQRAFALLSGVYDLPQFIRPWGG